MGIRNYHPTSKGRREMQLSDFSDVTSCRPEKSLIEPLKKTGGRNNQGRVTVRFIGGGHKRNYRIIDFKRNKLDVPGTVASIEYDPNRTCRIALINYADGEKRYILAPNGLKVGDKIIAGNNADIIVGNAMALANVPLGTLVHNVELKPGKGGQMVRSAGMAAQIVAKEGEFVTLRMPSGEMRKVSNLCFATIGEVGNHEHENEKSGKAGRSRWLGKMPHNRGTTMNPVDHPHGGGEGKGNGGRQHSSPWGWITKGPKTRKNTRTDYMIVKRRGK